MKNKQAVALALTAVDVTTNHVTVGGPRVQGMPYMTVRYVGVTPTIEAQAGSPITWLNSLPVSTRASDPPTAATGTVFKVRGLRI